MNKFSFLIAASIIAASPALATKGNNGGGNGGCGVGQQTNGCGTPTTPEPTPTPTTPGSVFNPVNNVDVSPVTTISNQNANVGVNLSNNQNSNKNTNIAGGANVNIGDTSNRNTNTNTAFGGSAVASGGQGGSSNVNIGDTSNTNVSGSFVGDTTSKSNSNAVVGDTTSRSNSNATVGNTDSRSNSSVGNVQNTTKVDASSGASTSNAEQSQNSSNQNTTIVEGDEAQKRNPVSMAYAAPLTSGMDTCMGSSSAGAQGIGFGISLGTTWTDKNCVNLKNARELASMGYGAAAVQLMCLNDNVRKAMKAAGTPCAVVREEKDEEVAAVSQINDAADRLKTPRG